MVGRALAFGLWMATVSAGRAQESVQALLDLPLVENVEGSPIRVVDWRTGEALPRALVIALPREVWPTRFERRDYVAAAARSGRRVPLDDDARGTVPTGCAVVVLDGDRWMAGVSVEASPVLAPAPTAELSLRIVAADGSPVVGYRLGGGVSDRRGEVRWRLEPPAVASTRYHVVGGLAHRRTPFGALPPGGQVVDLRASAVGREPREVRLPETGTLHLVGLHDGAPESIGSVSVIAAVPFDGNVNHRSFAAAGAELRVTGLPLGVPVRFVAAGHTHGPIVLRTTETVRMELQVEAPPPELRYRPVDENGNVLRLHQVYDGGVRIEGGMVVVRWRRGRQRAIVRLRDEDHEEWSCAPFELPDLPWPRAQEVSDLVLTASSRSLYCAGRVVDRDGRPVATQLSLSDGNGAWAGGSSDDEGRFRIHIGPWFQGPMGLYVPEYGRMLTPPVARGREDVVVTVGEKATREPAFRGRLRGLLDLPVWPHLAVEAREHRGSKRCAWSGLRRHGRFGFSLQPGTYDVVIGHGDGAGELDVLANVTGLVLADRHRREPATVELSLPDTLRPYRVRLVDADGRPCPVPGITSDATACVQVLVPAEDGADVEFGPILRRVHVRGDREVEIDPVIVDVVVNGLPGDGSWIFGLAVRGLGLVDRVPVERLVGGRGRMFVPRGAPLQLELHAMQYDARGLPNPAPWAGSTRVHAFEERIVVPPEGPAGGVQLEAPADLAARLTRLAKSPR